MKYFITIVMVALAAVCIPSVAFAEGLVEETETYQTLEAELAAEQDASANALAEHQNESQALSNRLHLSLGTLEAERAEHAATTANLDAALAVVAAHEAVIDGELVDQVQDAVSGLLEAAQGPYAALVARHGADGAVAMIAEAIGVDPLALAALLR